MKASSASDEKELKKDLSTKLGVIASDQQEQLARHRAETMGLPYINLVIFPIDPDILEQIPKSLAEKAQAVIFYKQGKDVRIGAVNPSMPSVAEVLNQVREHYNVEPQMYVISTRSFKVAFSRYRREQTQTVVPTDELRVEQQGVQANADSMTNLRQLGAHITELPPTQILSTIVSSAVSMEASDVHIEPQEQTARLRYRIDGVLQDVAAFPRSAWQLILSRVKVLSKLKLNIREVPQDGSFVLKVGDTTYDIRVSTLPGGDGENIVMRLLNRSVEVTKVTDLGMKKRDYDAVIEQLKQSNGMILVTGPTGSGKTTSLAAFIMQVNTPDLKVITLEDPIEYRLPGVEQTEVDQAAGYTFAAGLRSILRQDPDIILVGEIRDTETAETAMHASLTGHLVFSTLHTNNAPGTVPRLLDMGIKPFIMAPAINLIIAQRLMRVVCKECAEYYSPDQATRDQIKQAMLSTVREVFDPSVLDSKTLQFKKAKGCAKCHSTGYKGRIGIFEVMPVTGPVEELILQGADTGKILEAALKAGMTTITQDAYIKVIEGVSTLEEIGRVTEE